MKGIAMLPKDLVIDIPALSSQAPKPFILNFLEKPNFSVESGLAIKGSNVTTITTTGGNDVFDYAYDD